MEYMEKVRAHFGPDYWASCRRRKVKPYREPKQAALGPIVRLLYSPYARSGEGGFYNVELPPTRSKMFGPLAVHPRLLKLNTEFCDDTLDGETIFCSAHHCEWAGMGDRDRFRQPYTITHAASGLGLTADFRTLSDASKIAARLTGDALIDWGVIDADHTSAEARPSMQRIRVLLAEWGLR